MNERSDVQGQVCDILQRVKYVQFGESLLPLANEIIALVRADERRRVATALLDEARVFDSDFASERTWDSGNAVKLEDDVRLILGAAGLTEGDDE